MKASAEARKARALDIWESLKPDVEMEMSRPKGWGMTEGIDLDVEKENYEKHIHMYGVFLK